MGTATTVRDRIQQTVAQKVSAIREAAEEKYQRLIPTASSGADVEELLEAAISTDRSDSELHTHVGLFELRTRQARSASMLQAVEGECQELGQQLLAAKKRREDILKPIDDEIKTIESKYHGQAMRKGERSRSRVALLSNSFDSDSNFAWLGDAHVTTSNSIAKLEHEAKSKPVPGHGECYWNWRVDRWEPHTNDYGQANAEDQAAYDEYAQRVADWEHRATEIQFELERLKRRKARLEQLALSPWPLRSELAAIDAEERALAAATEKPTSNVDSPETSHETDEPTEISDDV